IGAQREREEERKTAYLRHGEDPDRIFSETIHRSNHEGSETKYFQSLTEFSGWRSGQRAEVCSADRTRAAALRVHRDRRNFLPMRSADGCDGRELRARLGANLHSRNRECFPVRRITRRRARGFSLPTPLENCLAARSSAPGKLTQIRAW